MTVMKKAAQAVATNVVQWVGTHYGFHPDESHGLWQAKRFGVRLFPGIREALQEGRLFFCDAGREIPVHRLPCKREHLLEIGIGGKEFDEHREDQNGVECAATLMHDHIGRQNDQVLNRMVQWMLRNDQEAIGTAFDWADITASYFHAGFPEHLVMKRSMRVYDAVYNYLSSNFKRRDITAFPNYWKLAAEFVLGLSDKEEHQKYRDKFAYHFSGPLQAAQTIDLQSDERISWMLNYEVDIKGLESKPPREPGFMEIPTIVRALYYDGASEGEVRKLVHEMLSARLVEQKMFLTAVDEFNDIVKANRTGKRCQNGRIFRITEADVTYKVAVVFSENRRIVSAVRSSIVKPHIIVRILPKTHHISVFTGKMDVTPIVVRLRAAIYGQIHNTPLPLEKLTQEWTLPEVPELCFQKNAGNILNSSFSAPHMSVIPLRVKDAMRLIEEGIREVARNAAQHRKETRKRQRERKENRKADVVKDPMFLPEPRVLKSPHQRPKGFATMAEQFVAAGVPDALLVSVIETVTKNATTSSAPRLAKERH